jgi:uncharacterized membrane protein
MVLLKIIGVFVAFLIITFYLVIVIGAGVSAGLRTYFKNKNGG